MKNARITSTEDDDQRLRKLLVAARPAVGLPPRFKQEVWRRIERTEASGQGTAGSWLEALLGRLLRPRILLAGAAALVIVSAAAGAVENSVATRAAARAQYIASVAPNTLR